MPKEEKSRREKAALKEMCKVLGGGLRGVCIYIRLCSLSSTNNVLVLKNSN